MKRFGWAAVLALAILAGVVMGMSRPAQQWEYRLEPKLGTRMEIPAQGEHQYQKFFETLGKEGWEYVGTFGKTGDPGPAFALVFRRPR